MTTVQITGAGTEFAQLQITHNGRTHIYTGATANMLLAAMRDFAANHIIKLQQHLNDLPDVGGHLFDINDVRATAVGYVEKLRKGEL